MVARRAEPDLPRGRVVRGAARTGSRGSRATATCAGPRTRPTTAALDRLTRETIWRVVTPRWRRHLERLVERERPDAVVVFTVPMAHFRGIPTALRERFGDPGRLLRRRRADEPAGVRRHGHRLQLLPRRRSVRVRPRPLELGGRARRGCSSSARAAPRRCFWGADPEFFAPQPVAKEMDVFFYGYGDKFRREWTAAMVGEPSRAPGDRLRARRPRLPRRHRARPRSSATCRSTSSRGRSRRRGSTSTSRAARTRPCPSPRPAARSSSPPPARRSSRTRTRASSAGSSRAARSSSSRTPRRARRLPRPARRPGAGGGDGRAGARARARRAHVRAPRRARVLDLLGLATPAVARMSDRRAIVADRPRPQRGGRDRRRRRRDPRVRPGVRRRRGRRRLGGRDGRGRRARQAPPSCGSRSTSASAAPCRPGSSTRSSTATSSPSGSTATASTIPPSSPKLLAPLERGEADIVTGLALRDGDGGYRPPLARRIGIVWFARLVSLLTRQRVTDTTSGFQALNRRGIALFAADYPSDYPGGRGDGARVQAPAAARRGAGADARARARQIVDHVRPLRSTTCSR